MPGEARRAAAPGDLPHPDLRGLDNSAADYACLANDVFSYRKEIEFEGELNNGVLVIQRFLEITPRRRCRSRRT